MHEKTGGPRRERQRAARSDGSERTHPGSESPPAPQAPSLLPPEFAAAVQVTDTERAWIIQHLGRFHENQLILDVVRRVKAGKEATVYLCSAHPSTGRAWIAAKLYRERSLRSSKNVGQYQQGRGLLDEDGNGAEGRSWRMDKAIDKKSKRGRAAVETSWLMHELMLLRTLHAEGGDVPEPIEHGEHALLMEFIGDETDAAPTLNDVVLTPDEAKTAFERVIFNVELLLAQGWVHGDLSAYNILWHRGRVVLIDFPQVADCRANPRARGLFERDIERVSQYFESVGWSTDPRQLARDLWSKHISAADGETSQG